jgi:hypothetical protein
VSDLNCSGALLAPTGGHRPPLQGNAQELMSLCIVPRGTAAGCKVAMDDNGQANC